MPIKYYATMLTLIAFVQQFLSSVRPLEYNVIASVVYCYIIRLVGVESLSQVSGSAESRGK